MDFTGLIVLIPSLNPDKALLHYVRSLLDSGIGRVVVVDDGSGPAYGEIFAGLAALEGCHVLGYPVNRGKGHALKHGLAFARRNYPGALGFVTADADGQHTLKDVGRLSEALAHRPGELLIGTRRFSLGRMPLKSYLGNRLTSVFFALLYGRWLPDTQTGLRGFSMELAEFFEHVPGSRYEYEMNVLIRCASRHIPFYRIPIETVYLEGNESSHFRPFRDSARIYWHLFRSFIGFASSSALSTLLDLGLFTALDKWLLPRLAAGRGEAFLWGFSLRILLATAVARLFSAYFNYRFNRALVFRARGLKGALGRYALLGASVILLSASLVSLLSGALGADRTLVKALVDTALFFVNYRAQRLWVFRQRPDSEA